MISLSTTQIKIPNIVPDPFQNRLKITIRSNVKRILVGTSAWEGLYEIFHVISVFWFPFCVTVVSYGIVICRLMLYSCQSVGGGANRTVTRAAPPLSE